MCKGTKKSEKRKVKSEKFALTKENISCLLSYINYNLYLCIKIIKTCNDY